MSIITPREYQIHGTNQLVRYISKGYKRLVFQMPTGSGKTVTFAYFLQRYFAAYPDQQAKVIVHRDRLKVQSEKTFRNFDIKNVGVFMVETFVNRLKTGMFKNTQLIIIDECHWGSMRKIFEYFPDAIIIGFTATPIAATKKHPLKADYEQIVVCTDIRELIALHEIDPTQGLVPAKHYCPPSQINKKDIKRSGGDYNMRSMSNELCRTKLVDGVLKAYVDIGEHQKTIVFNSLVDHSLKVNDCFVAAGYNSRHLDGTMSKIEQDEIFQWFSETPDAILQTVDMATTGFDEPSIINVIPNRLTLSLPLWLQMAGRGARPYPGKAHFNLIDPVGNVEQHGRWDHKHDWYSLFHYPAKAGKGVAPMKVCPNPKCGCMIYMSSTKCEYCGHLFPRDTVYTDMVVELQLVPDNLIIPRNSPITLEKTIMSIAETVKSKPIDLFEKRNVMEYAVRKLHQQSGLNISSNMAVHLASRHI